MKRQTGEKRLRSRDSASSQRSSIYVSPGRARGRSRIDGLSVIALFVFAVALMEGVAANIIADPFMVLSLIALAFALSLALTALTVLARAGLSSAMALGLAAGSRNMGLVPAAAGSSVPDLTWLYFALAQFPIYLLPQMLKPLARRINSVA
jgi:hypothetical protein